MSIFEVPVCAGAADKDMDKWGSDLDDLLLIRIIGNDWCERNN